MRNSFIKLLLVAILTLQHSAVFAQSLWDGITVATRFHSGSGTYSNPYLIYTASQWVYFLNTLTAGETYQGKYVKLMTDIDLGSRDPQALGDFCGNLDGGNHWIKGFLSEIGYDQIVLGYKGTIFLNVSGTIHNLAISGSTYGNYNVHPRSNMAIAYNLKETGTIYNCVYNMYGGTYAYNASTMAYHNYGKIDNCYSYGYYHTVFDWADATSFGCICFENYESGIIRNCYFDFGTGSYGGVFNITSIKNSNYSPKNSGIIESSDDSNTWVLEHTDYNYSAWDDSQYKLACFNTSNSSSHTVTFIDELGLSETCPILIEHGKAIGELPLPHSNKTFVGWQRNNTIVTSELVVNSDWTLFAKWTNSIQQQPTVSNPIFMVDDENSAKFQWYKTNGNIVRYYNWTSSNHNSSSISDNTVTIDAKEGETISFDWFVDSEIDYDKLNVLIQLNGITLSSLCQSGSESGHVDYEVTSGGMYQIYMSYSKDESDSRGSDQASVTNIVCKESDVILTGETSNTLSTGTDGEKYYCIATYADGTNSLTSDTILFAAPIYYDLIYTVDGAEYQRATVEEGATITLIDKPTKDGYTFTGWSGYPEDLVMPNNDVIIIGTFTKNVEPEPDGEPDTDIADIANTIYFDNAEALKGREFTLSVKMKNSIEPTGFQFDLYLPDGVNVVQDADGFCDVALSTERTTTAKTNTFDSAIQRDDALRVLAASTKNYAFSGNDGEVCTIKLIVDESLEPGDYSLILKNIEITNNAGATWSTEYLKRTLTVVDYTLGDVNADTKINVGDFSAIASHIMGDTPAGFVEKAADVNNDTKINVGDLSGLVTLIMNGGATQNLARMRRTQGTGYTDISELDNVIYPSEFNVAPGADAELVFNMKNDFGATGFQFDFTLPEGMSIPEVEDGILDATLSTVRTTAQKTNTFECGKVGNNTYRVLVASTRNYEYEGNDGEVVRVRIHADENMAEGSYALNLTAITLTDAHGATYDTEKLIAELKVGEEEIIYAQGYTVCTTPIATTAGAANTIVLNFAGVDEDITDIEFDMEMPACLTRTKSGRVTKAFEGADENRMWVSGTEGDHTITVDGTHVTIAAIVDDEYKYIAGTSGALVNMYYTTATGTADGIYPINLSNITMKNGDGDILKLAPTTSYIKVGNPTGESLALVGHVAEEVNNALATEKALATVDMSKVVSMDGTLTLVDGRDFIAPKKSVTAPAVTYDAVIASSLGYKTLVLPYDCTVPAGFEAYEVGSVTGGTLDMVAVNTITANKPVILKNAGTATLSANNVEIVPVEGALTDVVLVGTYEAINAPVGSYVLQSHGGNVAFYPVTEAAQPVVGAFRAYLSIPSNEARIRVVFDGEATGIEDASDAIEGNAVYFNIAGQRVSKFAKGIVINNGHKIVK